MTLHYRAQDGETYQLNFIDTPGQLILLMKFLGHCQLVKGRCWWWMLPKGWKPKRLRFIYHAIEQDLTVLPVLNKIDLPQADPEKVGHEIEEIIGLDATDAVCVSAKTGLGIEDLLERLVRDIHSTGGM